MKTNKLKIHCFDDEAIPASWVEIAICPFHDKSASYRKKWTNDNVDYKRFQSVGEAISYYELTTDYPDLIAIDIDSRELHPTYTLSEEQKILIPLKYKAETERTSTRGRSLMDYAREKFPNCESFFITGQASKREVFNEVVNAVNEGLVTISRDKSEAFEGIQMPILNELKQVAKKYFNKVSALTKNELKGHLFNLGKEEFLTLNININGKDYQLRDILISYLPLDEDGFQSEINKLLLPNLTLSASEFFGVLGIKALTHKCNPVYFPYGTKSQLINEVKRQFECFESVLSELKNALENESVFNFIDDSFKVNNEYENFHPGKDFKNDYDNFKKIAINEEVNSEILTRLRNKNFRFGSKSDLEIRQTITINGIEPSGEYLIEPYYYGNFEINLPIHLFFCDIFDRIYSKNNGGNDFFQFDMFSIIDDSKKLHHPNNISPNNKIHYKTNFLIIPSKASFRENDIKNTVSPPDHFNLMKQKHFEYFGNYYVITKDNRWKAFNCTDKDFICELSLSSILPNELKMNIESQENFYSFHLFTFNAWNQ